MNRPVMSYCCSAVLILGFVSVAASQPGGAGTPLPSATGLGTTSSTASTPAMDAERAKIWNSPTMLRARAWVQEYCARSAKITPAEAQQYMTELSQLTPVQMKLWLLKFDHEEETIRQQQAAFNASRQGSVQAAMGMRQETEKAYADINRDETEAAQNEQQSINTEQQEATERGLQNTADRDAAVDSMENGPLYGAGYGYGFGGLYGGGDYHLHYHVHN